MLVPQITILHLLVQDCYLILNAVFFAFQRLLGDALDSHQSVRPLLLGQDHLWESSSETQTRRSASPTLSFIIRVQGSSSHAANTSRKTKLALFCTKIGLLMPDRVYFNHSLLVKAPTCWLKLWWACKLVGWFGGSGTEQWGLNLWLMW